MPDIVPLKSAAFVNLTEIAKAYEKRVDNWARLRATKELIKTFKANPCYTGIEPIISSTGGAKVAGAEEDRGTFAHPIIASAFIEWCKKTPTERPSSVYLIGAVGAKVVKIGIAGNAFSRARSMQVGSPLQLVVLRVAKVENARFLESRLHEYFKPYHSHGEWFEIDLKEACRAFDQVTSKWTVTPIR